MKNSKSTLKNKSKKRKYVPRVREFVWNLKSIPNNEELTALLNKI